MGSIASSKIQTISTEMVVGPDFTQCLSKCPDYANACINLFNKSVETIWILYITGGAKVEFCTELLPGEVYQHSIFTTELRAGTVIMYYRNPKAWNPAWPYMEGMTYRNISYDYSQVVFISLRDSLWRYNIRDTKVTVPVYMYAPCTTGNNIKIYTDQNWEVVKTLNKEASSNRMDIVIMSI